MAVNVFFLRVSSQGSHLESQFDEVWNEYAKSDNLNRETIRVIENKESGVKLSEEERLGITQLKHLVETEGVDVVYTSELSRLARSEKVLWSLVEFLKENKIQLKCKNPKFVLLEEDRSEIIFTSRLIVSTFGSLATQEAIEKKARFARGKKRLADTGRYNGGAIPFGYKVDKSQMNKIVINEEEASLIREIYDLYERGFSQMAITKILYFRKEEGRAVRKTPNITISFVHQILTNELLTGVPHKSKGASYVRTYDQIITPEQFARCREIAQKNNTKTPKGNVPYYGAGIIKCVKCGRNFATSGQAGYYKCHDANNTNKTFNGYPGEPRCTNRVTISYNIMDALLWDIAQKWEGDYLVHKMKVDEKYYDDKIQEIEKELVPLDKLLDEINNKLNRLSSRFVLENMDIDTAEKLSKKIKEEKQDVIKRKQSLVNDKGRYEMLKQRLSKRVDIYNMHATRLQINEQLSSIKDDDMRREIVRRNVRQATVEACQIKQSFASCPEGKLVKAKLITLVSTYDVVRMFYFVPFDGKGGYYLSIQKKGDKELLTRYDLEAFDKRYAKHKYVKREKERERKREIKGNIQMDMTQRGYISMDEMMLISRLSYSTIYKAIKSGALSGAENVLHKWYVPRSVFVSYLHDKSPKPRVRHIN